MSRNKQGDFPNFPNEDLGATLQLPPEDFVEDTQSRHTYKQSEPVVEVAEAVAPTVGFRSSRRSPLPVLRIFDDNQQSGENLRIRKSPFVLGRTEGDLTIPLDAKISGCHAEIGLNPEPGGWYLKDLGSTNGTFVRVSKAVLKNGQVLVIGDSRFVFDLGQAESQPSLNSTTDLGGTLAWQAGPADAGAKTQPALVRSVDGVEGQRFHLTASEHWIGRDPDRCTIVLEDPTVDARHARIFQDRRGRWSIKNHNSLNGLWVQIKEIALGRGAYFQCGEQRFLFKILR